MCVCVRARSRVYVSPCVPLCVSPCVSPCVCVSPCECLCVSFSDRFRPYCNRFGGAVAALQADNDALREQLAGIEGKAAETLAVVEQERDGALWF